MPIAQTPSTEFCQAIKPTVLVPGARRLMRPIRLPVQGRPSLATAFVEL